MKTYEFNYHPLEGEWYEGTISLDLTEKEIKRITQEYLDYSFSALDDREDLNDIYEKAVDRIADWELGNTDYLQEILDNYSVDGGSNRDAMLNYLHKTCVHVLFGPQLEMDLLQASYEEMKKCRAQRNST